MGYSRPNSDFTFFRASSMRLRLSGLEKSMNGSFVNSETWTVFSAVAMADFLLDVQTTYCTAFGNGGTSGPRGVASTQFSVLKEHRLRGMNRWAGPSTARSGRAARQ